MRKSNVALRLQESLLIEVRSVAEAEGVALNQFINVAVAEKVVRAANRGLFSGARRTGYRGKGETTAGAGGQGETSGSRR